MTDTLAHRGPDGSGVWRDARCGLGHRRLSIIDLGGGAQPMVSADGSIAVSFNGEIYNHEALRRELEALGHRFRTRSDTEVLVHGYRQWGNALPGRLNGMFAFVAWDARNETALIARDRMGQKPLFYTHRDDGSLLVASELKALLEHPGVERRADPVAIAQYLTYEYIPHPWSAIAGVHKLPPGDLLRWKRGELTRHAWARPPFGAPSSPRSTREWVAETRAALSVATRRRLMSDVPLGVFLSGGLDSSAVVALMAEHRPAREIQTFSIAFEDESFDESSWAEKVASHFGTEHRVRLFSPDALAETLPFVVSWLDEPFGDASLLPTHLLSRFTREHVKVAVGGDGGDELFCGYESFRADTAARLWKRLPVSIREVVREGVEHLPVEMGDFSFDFVAKSFVRGADAAPELRHTRWLSSFIPNSADDPLRRDLRASIPDGTIFDVMAAPYLDCPDPRHLQRLSYAYMRTYLAEDILTKVDRASMGVGLEVRTPFMDPELVSLVARMPPELKLRHGFTAKWALKKALEADLPHEIIHRKKKGFGIPVARWLNGPLAGELDRLLDPERIAAAGYLEPAVVSRLIAEHRSGVRDHRKGLWSLMMLEYWRERYDVRL